MTRLNSPLELLFYSGNYKQLLDASFDSPSGDYPSEDAPFVIGALTFRGRLHEAQLLFNLNRDKFSELDLVIARFFLGVGHCRVSQYATARGYFGANFKLIRAEQSPQIRFFCWQGIGFYRSFFGRYRRAFQVTQNALAAAIEANYLYGKALAADLLGHCQILPGEISSALSSFDQAIKSGKLLGDGGLVEAFEVSRAMHSAQFGLDPQNDLARLEQLSSTISSQDNYSHSRLLVELGRQYVLRGDIVSAKAALNRACHLIYASKNRRLSILLNLRFAYVALLEGDPHAALNLVRNAGKELDPAVDRSLEFQVVGLERKVRRSLGFDTDDGVLKSASSPGRKGQAIHHRILLRETAADRIALYSRFLGDDPLGDLIDECVRAPRQAVSGIASRGYFGLLYKVRPQAIGMKLLLLDLEPNSLTIFSRGNVVHHRDILTSVIRQILLCLASGQKTKEQIIQAVWGYSYRSLQHDPLVYRSISRLRALLGSFSQWIEPTLEGYKTADDVRIEIANEIPMPMAKHATDHGSKSVTIPASGLNFRQTRIVDMLRQQDHIDVKDCVKVFGVSEITARRDLSELCDKEFAEKLGKGKATKYRLRG